MARRRRSPLWPVVDDVSGIASFSLHGLLVSTHLRPRPFLEQAPDVVGLNPLWSEVVKTRWRSGSQMYILGMDTATKNGGVALSRDRELIGLVMMKTTFRYSQTIIHLVDFLLRQHDLRLREMDCLAVATGPGSFTGLRVGLATVKAFGQSLHRRVVGISTLKALAYRFRWCHSCLAPMIDAGREQIYGAVYRVTDSGLEIEVAEQVLPPHQWLKTLPAGEYAFVGDGSVRYRDLILEARPNVQILATDNRIIEELCELARLDIEEGRTVSPQQLSGNYIRPSDAELSRGRDRRPEGKIRSILSLDPGS